MRSPLYVNVRTPPVGSVIFVKSPLLTVIVVVRLAVVMLLRVEPE